MAHAALLRKWPLLKSRVGSARAFLIGKQQLEQDLRDWAQAAEPDKAGALLTGLKISRASRWLSEHPNQLSAQERMFIQAGIDRAEAETSRNEQRWRVLTWSSFAAAVVLAGVAIWAVREGNQAKIAQEIATANESRALTSERQANDSKKAAVANKSRALTALSQAASLRGHYTDAVKLALAAWPRTGADERPELSRTIQALGQALAGPLVASPPLRHDGQVYTARYSPDGARILTASADNTAGFWTRRPAPALAKPYDMRVQSMRRCSARTARK